MRVPTGWHLPKYCILAALVALPETASAQTMNAEAFFKRAAALEALGPLALLKSDEIKALTDEAKAAGKRADAIRAAAIKAHRKPRYCPPNDQVKMDSSEFMARLRAIAKPVRMRIDMTEATTRIAVAKYPCR